MSGRWWGEGEQVPSVFAWVAEAVGAPEEAEEGVREALGRAFRSGAAGWGHYRRARLFLTRAETIEALTRGQAAFQAARQAVEEAMGGMQKANGKRKNGFGTGEGGEEAAEAQAALDALREWCAGAYERVRELRREVEGGGRDELPPL